VKSKGKMWSGYDIICRRLVARSQPGHSLTFQRCRLPHSPPASFSASITPLSICRLIFFLLFPLSLIYTHTNGERQVGRYAGSATRRKYLYVRYMSPFFVDFEMSLGLGIRTRRRRQEADTRVADQTHMRSRTITRMRCRT
jgi:hypothetical protein